MTVEEDFLDTRIVAIIRGASSEDLDSIVRSLIAGGIKLLEITLNSPNAYNSISAIRQKYGDQVHVGAGTVLSRQMVINSVSSGAEFIVTPNSDIEVIRYCVENDILIMPGALTPSEIKQTIEWGAKYVKIFPIRAFGSQYIRDILAPLNTAKIIAVGGVDSNNATEYKDAGAFGLGVGGSLCKVPVDGNYKRITEDARKLIQIFKNES